MRTAVPILTAAMLAAFMAAVMAAVLAWSASAKANEIDLSTWTCKQFQSASKDEITLILAWLDGYYRAEDDPPVVDTDQLGANAKKLGAYCAAHPDTKLITAADTLFERE
ncbi:MAG: HdeA/HdeB family chaperone [Xanthobacteraceae bacterium]|jgi:acid stress chaperone HdeB